MVQNWVVVSNIFHVHPENWIFGEDEPILTIAYFSNGVGWNHQLEKEVIPSRELTYPTLGKRKIIHSKAPFQRGCDSSRKVPLMAAEERCFFHLSIKPLSVQSLKIPSLAISCMIIFSMHVVHGFPYQQKLYYNVMFIHHILGESTSTRWGSFVSANLSFILGVPKKATWKLRRYRILPKNDL